MSVFPAIGMDRGLRRARWLGGLVVAAALALAGCGQLGLAASPTRLRGQGQGPAGRRQAARRRLVSFVPKGDLPVTPSGVIGSDGTFSLVTGGSGEGAPAGEYKVRIEAPQFQALEDQEAASSRPSTPTRTAPAWSSQCGPRQINWTRSVLK